MYFETWQLILLASALALLLVLIIVLIFIKATPKHHKTSDNKLKTAYNRVAEYLLSDDFERAATVLVRLTKEDLEDANAYILLARIFGTIGEEKRGIELLQTLLLRPKLERETHVAALVELARLLLKLDELKKAENALRDAIHLSGTWETPYRLLAEVLARQNRFDEAHKALRKWEKLAGVGATPLHGKMILREAEMLISEGNLTEAKKLLEKSRKRLPDSPYTSLVAALIAAADNNKELCAEKLASALINLNADADVAYFAWKIATNNGIDKDNFIAKLSEALASRKYTGRRSLPFATLLAITELYRCNTGKTKEAIEALEVSLGWKAVKNNERE